MPKVATPSPCLLAALEYLERGYAPIPLCPPDHTNCGDKHRAKCKTPGKAPIVREWQEKRLTAAELEGRWKTSANANVGLAMGLSRLVGLDIDGPEGEACLSVKSGPENVPPTWMFSTPNGGHRLLYALPEGVEPKIESFKGSDQKEAFAFWYAAAKPSCRPLVWRPASTSGHSRSSPGDLPITLPCLAHRSPDGSTGRA